MARLPEIDRMLWEWVEWRRGGGPGTATVADIAAAITGLPDALTQTLDAVYFGRCSSAEACRRLGCPEATVVRRIGRAHLLLSESLAKQRDDRRRADEHAAIARRRMPEV
jgi:DNA-directed RNA polymerase specialized sigma24 family protein